jgi:hypothetical protein
MTTLDRRTVWENVTRLVAEHRDRCLWFLAPDFEPTDDQSAIRALRYIERYGDKAARDARRTCHVRRSATRTGQRRRWTFFSSRLIAKSRRDSGESYK